MALSTLALIVFVGFLILMVELFLAQGSIVFGILGVVVMLGGVAFIYQQHGVSEGNLVLAISLFASIIATVVALRFIQNSQLNLTESLDGRANDFDLSAIRKGDVGVAQGDIKPTGRARFKDQLYSVYSQGEFIEENNWVRIVRIEEQKIFVESINKPV